jgi:hypothetical protein
MGVEVSDYFELPTDTIKKPAVNPDFEGMTGLDAMPTLNPDFETTSEVASDGVSDNFEMEAGQIIDRSPDPKKTLSILEKARAIRGITGASVDESFQKAEVFTNTKDPQAKKLGTAIADRWTAEKLTVQIGQAGNNARKAYKRGDQAEYERWIKEYDTLSSRLPKLEDVEPAYPGGVFGKVISFGRRAVTGAAGLVSQQVEMVSGQQALEGYKESYSHSGPLSFAYLKYAGRQGLQSFIGIGEVEGGSAFMDMVKNGVDPSIADRFARGIGAINNMLELAQVATFVKMFPGAEAAISKATSGLIRKALLGPVFRNKALQLTVKLTSGAAGELGQEIAQEAVTFYGENFAAELNDAVKGTDLERNTDFLSRAKAIVRDFLPGVLALGAIPIGFQAFKKGETAKAGSVSTQKAITAVTEPSEMDVLRSEMARATEAKTVEAVRPAIEQATAAKAKEIASAEALTPQMVNEAVELADMQDAAEQVTAPAEVAPEVAQGTEVTVPPNVIKDAEGQPATLYHGSREKFDTFDKQKSGGMMFFAEDKTQAESYGDVGEYVVRSDKPIDLANLDYADKEVQNLINDWASEYDDWTDRETGEERPAIDWIESGDLYNFEGTGSGRRWRSLFKHLENNGYDSVRIFDVTDGVQSPTVVVFDPERIVRKADYEVASTGMAQPAEIAPTSQAMKEALPTKDLEGEAGYIYHATNVERAAQIADEGVVTHKPNEFTDQSEWPDGAVNKRSYWSEKAGIVWQFAPEEGAAVVLRTRQETQFKRESTGDIYTTKPVAPEAVEILGTDGNWYPIKDFYSTTGIQPTAAIQSPDATRASVDSGVWVDDATLGQFSGESWAKDELSTREDLRDVASYLADSGQATSFDSFVTAAKQIEITPRSDEYYQNIWDTTPKAEVELDEDQTVSTDALIDATIAAEEKQAKRVPVIDRLLAELEATPMWNPESETVSDVLTAKEEKASKAEAGEELSASRMANDLLRNKKKLVQKLTHDFLKTPGAGVGQEAINQVRALQESYTAKETKNLKQAKKAIQDWRTAHPGQSLIPEAQTILDRKSIKDISVGELIDLWKQSREIRQKGAAKTKAQREAIKARRVQMATDLMGEIPGGMLAERLGEFASEATQKQERALARKGKIKSNLEHPLRLFKSMGKTFEKVFWDDRKVWEGKEIIRQRRWDRSIADLYKKTGTTAKEMLRKLPGTDYYIDDLMTYYGQMQDSYGRKAVLFGNDENETTITRLVGQMPQKYKDFVDGVIDLNNRGYGEVEKVQIEQNATVAPKIDRYLPLRREGDFGKPFSAELSTDAGIRESVRVAGLQKGFTKERTVFKEGRQQSRIRTDFLNILAEQIAKESKYVEGEAWARDMGWLLGGKSKEGKQFLEAVKQKHGQPVVTFLKDYANAVVKPESFNGQDFQGLISRVFRNMSAAALMYKLSVAFIQVEGPFRTLSQLDLKQWHYLMAGLWKASTSPNKSAEFVYSKAPVMQAMAESEAIDPALQEGRGYKHSKTSAGLALQGARRGMQKGGYAMLQAMNKWTIVSEWTAVYYANRVKLGEEAAIKAANDAVYLNQPSGKLADAPRMYWTSKSNIILSFLQRFTRATNQMAQMMTVDLWNDLKTGHPGKALGVVLSFAIGAYLNGLRKRKRPPETPEEFAQDAIEGLTDTLGSMTYGAVSAAVAGATGDYTVGDIKPLESVYKAGAIGKDVLYGNVSEKEVYRLINLVMQATGLPVGAAENVVRSAYDFEEEKFRFDPVELFGRRPKE